MDEYKFNIKEYKKKISYKSSTNSSFYIYVFICIILMGAVFFLKPKTQKNKDAIYFVSAGYFLNYTDANNLAQEIQTRGGAGYVFFDGKYNVFANLYFNKSDANAVLGNVKEEYPASQIYELEISKNLNVNKLTDTQKNAIKNLLENGSDCLQNLYNNILAYDKNEIKYDQLILNFKTLKSGFDNCYNNFSTAFEKDSKYNKAKSNLEELRTCLNNLTNETNCNLKYELVKYAINFCAILNCFS